MDNVAFGLQTTLLGMGIVFGVLAVLWALVTLVARLDADGPLPGSATTESTDEGAIQPAPAPPAPVAAVRLEGAPDGLDPRLAAAITVAILRHEEARRLQAAPAMRSYWPGSLLFASRWVAAGRTRQGQSWRRRR